MSSPNKSEIKGYELYEMIGKGGFGSVYRAFQPLVNREVAIKVINAEYANNIHFILHFEVEAQLIARLEHPHIVPLYDYWREPNNAYLVMRWLRGGSVYHALKERGAWSPKAVLKLVEQMASALTAAHRHGVIHRDLKPANILLDEDHNAYLSDFGIAKDLTKSNISILSGDDDARHGSPAYMSPEQIMNVEVNSRTDIYSLGIVTYELLHGAKPFQATTDEGLMRLQLTEELPSLRIVHPDLPSELDVILQKATNKDPRARYHSPLGFAEDLRRVLAPMLGISVELQDSSKPAPPAQKQTEVKDLIEIAERIALEIPNPYKGLRAFQEADASDFCGRDALVEDLLFRIGEVTEGSRFLAVVGPSGSGKSSVVKAGVIPALRRGRVPGSGLWFIVEMTPRKQALKELENALLKIATRPLPALGELLRRDANGLLEAVDQAIPTAAGQLVLVIDQFEELFTLTQDESERAHFLHSLLAAVNAENSRLRVIITLRADFYDRPLLYPGFGELMRNRTAVVLPMTVKELEAAIVQPAERAGLSLEPGLVPAIITDISEQPGALPLLQFALTELFVNRKGTMLTLSAYQKNGGVSGALTRRADEIYALMNTHHREITRQIFLRLVALGDGVEETRRRVLQAELMSMQSDGAALLQVLNSFGKHRLLTFDYEPGTRAPTVEIAHEALIRAWKLLREWLDANRDELRVQRRLSAATLDWARSKRDSSYLATGARLSEFELLAKTSNLALNQEERDYIHASLALRERAKRRLYGVIAVLAVLVVISVIAARLALDGQQRSIIAQATAVAERDRANVETQRSRSRELAVTALINEDQFDLALLLSMEGMRSADTFEARNSLLTILQSKPNLISILHPIEAPVRAVAISPDGAVIASSGEDARIRLWDASTFQPLGQPLVGHGEPVNALAFSPDGHTLASGSEDDSIILWDTTNWQPIGDPLSEHTDDVWALAFSPDGRILASASADTTIRLWDAHTGKPITQPLTGHHDTVYSLAFSPDGHRLASGSADNDIRLWNVPLSPLDLITSQVLKGHTNWVLTLAFSPDGTLLASGSANNVIRIWDTTTRDNISELRGHRNWVRALTWGADDQTLISGSQEGRMVIWNLAERRALQELIPPDSAPVWSLALSPDRHTLISGGGNQVVVWDVTPNGSLFSHAVIEQDQPVAQVVFSPDGHWLASADSRTAADAGTDSAIHLWDVSQPHAVEDVALRGHLGIITGVVFSPDSTRLISGSTDSAVILWDIASGEPIATLRDENSVPIFSIALSTDGRRIAAGGIDGSIALWSASDDETAAWQREDELLRKHGDRVLSLVFSPNGQWLASGSRDGTIIVWDTSTGEPMNAPIAGHTDGTTSLAFSPDGTLLASGGRDNVIRLWNVRTGEIIGQPLIGHLNWIQSVAFSPDGTLLASGSADNTVRLWDTEQLRPLGQPLTGHSDWVSSVAFSPDSLTLASGGTDKKVILWDVGMSAWHARACHMANRNLDQEEWERYLPGSPYQPTCLPE